MKKAWIVNASSLLPGVLMMNTTNETQSINQEVHKTNPMKSTKNQILHLKTYVKVYCCVLIQAKILETFCVPAAELCHPWLSRKKKKVFHVALLLWLWLQCDWEFCSPSILIQNVNRNYEWMELDLNSSRGVLDITCLWKLLWTSQAETKTML